ncbi:hypothetical protein BTH73_04825 [Lactobacillus delbrueckii subsp. bulgaricus]|nr:hypothetical protein [Lactobacillus delbrueckii subsp. bulgaricus]MBT8999540.1 hypothetical protein [Lactobacillus delbrueckii subsp. bulgaricus]MBT9025209.1 hypothetical protein [Lactobacillus delbrueckii subsp. bulgaricus]MBT9074523.1 hypothetical protein [Lactobacillus delbrueckii subsp. bulgaricus]
MFAGSWKYLLSGIVMFVPVFWLNTHMKASWLWILIEILIGIIIYVVMLLLLKPPMIYQAKSIYDRVKKR